ncbi:MAG: hypothetical protein R3B74_15415 [Nitrospirales bacterium]|nr:hypothetical protein [Nitrospirales bacterium]
MGNIRRLLDAYHVSGFRPKAKIKGIFGDPKACVIRLERRPQKRCAGVAALVTGVTTIASRGVSGTFPAGMWEYIWPWPSAASPAGGAAR